MTRAFGDIGVHLHGLALKDQRLKNFCEDNGVSVSGYLEQIIADKLDAQNVPVPEKVEPRPTAAPKAAEPDQPSIVSQHFTF